MNLPNGHEFAVIALSAVLVYAIRFSGLVFGEKLPRTGFWKRAMDALPGIVGAGL